MRNWSALFLTIVLIVLAAHNLMKYTNKIIYAQEISWPKIFNNYFISSLDVSPWGVLAGEYDTRLWTNPFNGVYISRDMGVSWTEIGLSGRGVTSVKYSNNKIYAGTYYKYNNLTGLFSSGDLGKTWDHLGLNFSVSSVTANKNTVVAGGFSHGLWISKDHGTTWEQKIGDGWFGPKITALDSTDDLIFASTLSDTYISRDQGATWEEIAFFKGKSIKYFHITNNIILAGSSGSGGGMYRSFDQGHTWTALENFGPYAAGGIVYFDGNYYSGRFNPTTNLQDIYKSSDLGNSWSSTGAQFPQYSVNQSMKHLYSKPSYIFALQASYGVHRSEIQKQYFSEHRFLNIPWHNASERELTDKIYSYFDHTYPLLGSLTIREPEDERYTTTNFYGIRETEPRMYYSAHDGYDFALLYGTQIRAAASGYAKYYWCGACGNAIQIEHQNGFQTVYYHLQNEGLITDNNEEIWVNEGDVIGKVGMTGNTNGPHLHFAVIKDSDLDNTFHDETPQGKIDPFGWNNQFLEDPRPLFTWSDTHGTHNGVHSSYIWKTSINESEVYVNDTSQTLVHENTTLKINTPDSDLSTALTYLIQNYIHPVIPEVQKHLKYITNTSILVTARDHFGNRIRNLSQPVRLTFNLSDLDLSNVVLETIKLYRWNEESLLWEELSSNVDQGTNTISAELSNLSRFILMGEKLDNTYPVTTILVEGTLQDGVYAPYPIMSLSVSDPSDDIVTFYVIGETEDWNEYKAPVRIEQNGEVMIRYRSQNIKNGNLEDVREQTLQILNKPSSIDSVIIRGTVFSVS